MTDDHITLEAKIARIQLQEERLVFTRFSHADAWALGNVLVKLATERNLSLTVDITRGQQQVFHAALAGTSADNDEWIARKVRVVKRFGSSSFLVGQRALAKGAPFDSKPYNEPTIYAAHGGSFPITIADSGPIGTVTVSGLPQEDDHELVVEAIELFLAGTGSGAGTSA